MFNVSKWLVVGAGLGLCYGCAPVPEADYVHSAEFKALNPKVQSAVQLTLGEKCGTPPFPRLLSTRPPTESSVLDPQTQHLLHGKQVYLRRCVQCHGASGDGQGPVAAGLYPRPRDYRRGIFKFTSTPFGSKPRREDLLRTIRRGVPGTSMPSFELLADKDQQAVLDYVLVLTHRGELEYLLSKEAQGSDELDPESVTTSVADIEQAWTEAELNEILPLSKQIQFTAEHVALGKKAFLAKGCAKCHGDDGRGQTPENLKSDLLDVWQSPTRAADLSSGMLHGGSRPLDVYRRIYTGVNGTPMPGFAAAFAEEPETLWHIVAFVLHVSNQRRRGELPESGELAPFKTVATVKPQP